MNQPLTSYRVTLPNGRAVTVEADSEETARAAAAIWMKVDRLPAGTNVTRELVAKARDLLDAVRGVELQVNQLKAEAEQLQLIDCATHLRDAGVELLGACCVLHTRRTDTSLARELGTDDQTSSQEAA
ncbi:MAG TPA: hypothetical protein VIT90_15245 [Lysobacter sp.]